MQRRWFVIILGVSVALNLFFLGLFSARALSRHDSRVMQPGHVTGAGRLPRFRQHQRPFEWMTDAERDELRPRRRQLRVSRRAAEDALRAEPFDVERLRVASSDLRRETDAIQALVHQFMLQRAAGMSSEERRRLADAQWGEPRGGDLRGGERRGGARGGEPRGQPPGHEPQAEPPGDEPQAEPPGDEPQAEPPGGEPR
jgi:uncharacterized membrane protein